jgi:hypothetical protein
MLISFYIVPREVLKEPFQNRLEPDEEGYSASSSDSSTPFSNNVSTPANNNNKGRQLIDGVALPPSPSSNGNKSPSGESYDVDEVKESVVPGWKVTPKSSAAGVHGASTVESGEGKSSSLFFYAFYTHVVSFSSSLNETS